MTINQNENILVKSEITKTSAELGLMKLVLKIEQFNHNHFHSYGLLKKNKKHHTI